MTHLRGVMVLPGEGKMEEMLPPEEIYINFHKKQLLETEQGSCSGPCMAGTAEVTCGASPTLHTSAQGNVVPRSAS